MIRLNSRKACLLAATCLTAIGTVPASAQTEIRLDELVVTATGRPEPRSSIPGTVQVIDSAQIERARAQSITDLLAENAAQGELDALTIRYGGQVRADNLRRAAANSASALNSQAALYQFEGQQRKFAGYVGAGTTLLQAAGSFARSTA